MKICYKKIGNRYAFDVLDGSKIIYASDVHYFLTPHVQSSYQYAWEACCDSYKLLFRRPHHLFAARDDMTSPVIIDVSAEQMLINHYLGIYKGLKEQAEGSKDDGKEKDFVYKSIKIVVGELGKILESLTDNKAKRSVRVILSRFKKLIRKYFQQEERKQQEEIPKMASSKTSSLQNKIDPRIASELMEDYAQRICQVIQDKHPDVYYTLVSSRIKIMNDDNDCILEASVNPDLNIQNIIPCGSLRKIYPYHSDCFYQKYWKPIVEAVGHFVIGDPPVLVVPEATTLPDVPKDRESFCLKGWDVKNQEEQSMEISFNKKSWVINPSQAKTASLQPSQYTEQDYLEAVIKCVDPKLESIYGRTGVVVQVIPHTDMIEIDVDFGRGLGTIRLTEKQIAIISV